MHINDRSGRIALPMAEWAFLIGFLALFIAVIALILAILALVF
jgi:hypothetical protein